MKYWQKSGEKFLCRWFLYFLLIFTHDNIYYQETNEIHWHNDITSINIPSLVCFARNGLLIVSHISGFVFHEILLWEIHSSKTNQQNRLLIISHISGFVFHEILLWEIHSSKTNQQNRLLIVSHISGFVFHEILLWEIHSSKTNQQNGLLMASGNSGVTVNATLLSEMYSCKKKKSIIPGSIYWKHARDHNI
jgi:hypothetical protein